MFQKITAIVAVLRVGSVVADPAKWKGYQITSSMLVALLWALVQGAQAFGYEIEVGSETVDAVAIGLLALINWVLTLTTSDKVGLPTKHDASSDPE